MQYAINIDGENRIIASTFTEYAPDNAIIVDELPEGDITEYLYDPTKKTYIYKPKPTPPQEPAPRYITYEEMDEYIKAGVNSI